MHRSILRWYDISISQVEVVVLHVRAEFHGHAHLCHIEAFAKVLLDVRYQLAPDALWEVEADFFLLCQVSGFN